MFSGSLLYSIGYLKKCVGMNTLFRLGYLKFQVAFLHPIYRLPLGACKVCAAGTHAVARYAKLPVLFQPRACILHAPYTAVLKFQAACCTAKAT